MQRRISVKNAKSVTVSYQIKDDKVAPPENNPTLASGDNLGAGQSRQHTVNTHSETSGDTRYYYSYKRVDDNVWRPWTGSWSSNGLIELI